MINSAFIKRDHPKKRALIKALDMLTKEDFAQGKPYSVLTVGELEDKAHPIHTELLQTASKRSGRQNPNIPTKASLRDHTANIISEKFARVTPEDRHLTGRNRRFRITPSTMKVLNETLNRWEQQGSRSLGR